MTTVASSVSVRDEALAVIAGKLGSEPALEMVLGEIGGAVFVDLLCALEQCFDIGLDVDELLPNGTIGVLAELVALRAAGSPRLYHWDDERLRRNLPYFGGRPRLASGSGWPSGQPAEREAKTVWTAPLDLAPPAWPDLLRSPLPARTPCAPLAIPSDEAWDTYAREERRRAIFLFAACVCIPFALGAAAWWLHLQGVV